VYLHRPLQSGSVGSNRASVIQLNPMIVIVVRSKYGFCHKFISFHASKSNQDLVYFDRTRTKNIVHRKT
jgi:hypothetical protein